LTTAQGATIVAKQQSPETFVAGWSQEARCRESNVGKGEFAGRRLADLTWAETRDAIAQGTGVILPVGATEQHGLHLPLATDYICATELALAVAPATNMLVAPAVTYGSRSRPLTGGGQAFAGTTSVRAVTLMSLITDVLKEFLRHGFRRLVLLNWHYENSNFVYEAAFEAMEHNDAAKILIFEHGLNELKPETIQTVFEEDFPGLAVEHAAAYETSVMLHLHPELVHFERAVDDRSARRTWYDIIPPPADITTRSGTLWKARRASAEKGRLLWGEIVPQVTEAIERDLAD
jgi:creatinine amidohydrolase